VANQRDIKQRIKSVGNTRKITSTMEMVSTAKMKKMQSRLEQSKPYEEKVSEIIKNLISSGSESVNHPLFSKSSKPRKVLILQITGNRGLCGSFNTKVIENTENFKDKLTEKEKEALLYVIGKKAISYYNFTNQEMFNSGANLEDKLSFEDASKISDEVTEMFMNGEVDEVYVSYTKVYSNVNQRPEIFKLLPISSDELSEKKSKDEKVTDYLFEPGPQDIFSYILPLFLKVKLYTCFLESAFSEQFARRVAMKNATDAAKDMISELSITYNRVRQDKITTELTEIIGGAAALE